MKKRRFLSFCCTLLLAACALDLGAQNPEADAKAKADTGKKAAEWVAELALNDPAKEARVAGVIATHLWAVREFHNSHPYTMIPEGINPTNGNKMSAVERGVIIASTLPKEVHDNLMNGLRRDLTEEQVEKILDEYTIGKVQFTLNGYLSIIPDLPKVHQDAILNLLKQAREMAVDYKNMSLISQTFEIYKTKCELYLYQNDYNWRKYFKAFVDARNAEKKAAAEAAAKK